jgi:hypothetical protein
MLFGSDLLKSASRKTRLWDDRDNSLAGSKVPDSPGTPKAKKNGLSLRMQKNIMVCAKPDMHGSGPLQCTGVMSHADAV